MLISVIHINNTYRPGVHGHVFRLYMHFILFMGLLQSDIDCPLKEKHLTHCSHPLNALMLIMIH